MLCVHVGVCASRPEGRVRLLLWSPSTAQLDKGDLVHFGSLPLPSAPRPGTWRGCGLRFVSRRFLHCASANMGVSQSSSFPAPSKEENVRFTFSLGFPATRFLLSCDASEYVGFLLTFVACPDVSTRRSLFRSMMPLFRPFQRLYFGSFDLSSFTAMVSRITKVLPCAPLGPSTGSVHVVLIPSVCD